MTIGGVCVQCAMKECVELLEAGHRPLDRPATGGGIFEGDPMEHMAKHHPNLVETQRERDDLERRYKAAFEKMVLAKQAKAKNARNN